MRGMADAPTSLVRSTTAAGAEVAVLTFDHGPLNLFDQAMFDAVAANVADLAANPPRAVLLRAEGKVMLHLPQPAVPVQALRRADVRLRVEEGVL